MRVTNNGSETPIAPMVAAARRFGTVRRYRASQGGNSRPFARQGPTAGLIVALCAVVASGILADPGAGTPATTVPSTNDHEETPTAATAQVLSGTVPTLAPAPLPVASLVDVRQEPDAPAFGWAGPAGVAEISRKGNAVAPPAGQP